MAQGLRDVYLRFAICLAVIASWACSPGGKARAPDWKRVPVSLETGGYGLIPSAALSGAPAISAKKYMIEDLEKLKKNPAHWDRMRAELETDLAPEEEEDN